MIRTCLPCVHPVLADGRAGVRGEVLEAGRVGGRGGDDRRVLQRAALLQRLRGRRRSWSPSGRSRRRCSGPASSGRRTPSCCFWLMIVSTQTAVLPVLRSPMISWRWPRPIGVMASMALMPVCSGSLTRWRCTTEAACSSSARRSSASISPRPSIGCAERVDDPAEEPVADRHREDLAGPLDLLALLDAGDVAEDDGADLARRRGSARRRACRPRTPAARWSSPRAGPRRGRCRRRCRRRCRPPRGRSPVVATRRSARSRSGSRPGRSSARSWLSLVPSSSVVRERQSVPAVSRAAAPGGGRAGPRRCRR